MRSQPNAKADLRWIWPGWLKLSLFLAYLTLVHLIIVKENLESPLLNEVCHVFPYDQQQSLTLVVKALLKSL
jgi:hypothetical protein